MTKAKWLGRSFLTATILAPLAQPGSAQAQAPAAPQAASQQQQIAAVVNGEGISVSDLDAVLRARGPSAVPPSEMQRKQQQFMALEMLIDNMLMQQYLRKNGPKVDPAEVNKRFGEFEEALKKQGRSLQEFYKDSNQNEFQVRTGMLNMLQWEAFVHGRITDADVKKYYDDNQEFFNGVQVRASHIVVRLTPESSAAERELAKTRLKSLRKEIAGGKLDFAEAAKKNSQCASAPNGGDLGYFTRKWMMDETFAKAAFDMKVGEVSDVVETEFGEHLIKVLDRKPGQQSDFAKIKNDVREFCVEEMRVNLLTQARKSSKIQINLK